VKNIIEKNIRSTIQILKKKGTTGMSISNLLQIVPTPPANMATDDNVSNYEQIFRNVAQKMSVNFEIF